MKKAALLAVLLILTGLIVWLVVKAEVERVRMVEFSAVVERYAPPSALNIDVPEVEIWSDKVILRERARKTANRAPRWRGLYASRGVKQGGYFVITAYCSCPICCGEFADGITASGERARWGVVAAPGWMPFGTRLRIEGFDTTFVVADRGGAIKGRRLDIWFPSHREAQEFGVKRLWVEIIEK